MRRFYYCVKKRRWRRKTSFISAEGGLAERRKRWRRITGFYYIERK